MKLIHSPASPFVRKVRATAAQLGIANDITLMPVKTTALDTAPEVRAANPSGKIPALITDDGKAIFDSRVICRYLNDRAGGSLYPDARIWDVLTMEAAADEIMVAGVVISYEMRLRPAEVQYAPWMDAQWSKITHTTQAFNSNWRDHLSGPVDAAQIALGCALGYLDFRHGARNWRAGCDNLVAWYEDFALADFMASTAPTD